MKMSWWASLSLGMALATKVMVIVQKYSYMSQAQVIAKVTAKLNETLDEMVIE